MPILPVGSPPFHQISLPCPPGPDGHGLVLPLQTSSTLPPVCAAPASTGAPAARAWLPAIAGAPPTVSAHAAPISHHRLIMVLPSPTSRVCSSPDISAMTGQKASNRRCKLGDSAAGHPCPGGHLRPVTVLARPVNSAPVPPSRGRPPSPRSHAA